MLCIGVVIFNGVLKLSVASESFQWLQDVFSGFWKLSRFLESFRSFWKLSMAAKNTKISPSAINPLT